MCPYDIICFPFHLILNWCFHLVKDNFSWSTKTTKIAIYLMKGHNSATRKMLKFKIKLGHLLLLPDLIFMCKFQMVCLRET